MQSFVYSSAEVPPELKWQILSFLRAEWPEGFVGQKRGRAAFEREPIYFGDATW